MQELRTLNEIESTVDLDMTVPVLRGSHSLGFTINFILYYHLLQLLTILLNMCFENEASV